MRVSIIIYSYTYVVEYNLHYLLWTTYVVYKSSLVAMRKLAGYTCIHTYIAM